jgi:hypothetical protein
MLPRLVVSRLIRRGACLPSIHNQVDAEQALRRRRACSFLKEAVMGVLVEEFRAIPEATA